MKLSAPVCPGNQMLRACLCLCSVATDSEQARRSRHKHHEGDGREILTGENQDTLSVESAFRMVFGIRGRYHQSNTEEGAHHRQAE